MTTPGITPDFRALCAELLAAFEIQIEEMSIDNRLCKRVRAALSTPPPKPLSPAAEAVLDAYWETFNAPLEGAIHRPLAAALRAVADQMPTTFPVSFSDLPKDHRRWLKLGYTTCGNTNRRWLNAIATELEGQP